MNHTLHSYQLKRDGYRYWHHHLLHYFHLQHRQHLGRPPTALVIPWLKYIEYWISPIDANSSSSSCIWHWYLNGLIIQLVEMGWGLLSMFEIILFPRVKWRKIFIGIDQILLSILCNIFIGKNIYICINLYYFRKNLFRSIKFRSRSINLSLQCGQ